MNALFVMVVTAAVGVEAGWQPLPGGGREYTIQLEPQLLRMLESGTEEIVSEVPAEIDVRRYRIIVGTGQLPRDAGPQARASSLRSQPPRSRPRRRISASRPRKPTIRIASPSPPTRTTCPLNQDARAGRC